jgi:NTE family protein
MAGGESFAFTPSRFDDICSDFDSTKLSTAVSASAAFPIALTPVTFKNFQPNCAGNIRDARWAEIEQAAPQGQLNVTEYRNARYTLDLRRRKPIFREIKFVHLLDGGLADNLGINAIRDALSRGSDDTRLLQEINLGHVHKLVVIIVNARSDPPNDLYKKQNASGLIGQLKSVTSVPIDANSLNAQQNIDRLLLEFARASVEVPNSDINLQVYNVAVDFDTIAADTSEHRTLRDAVKAVPTSWNISADQLSTVDQAANLILDNDGCYRQLLVELKATGGPQTPAPVGCKTRVRRSP